MIDDARMPGARVESNEYIILLALSTISREESTVHWSVETAALTARRVGSLLAARARVTGSRYRRTLHRNS